MSIQLVHHGFTAYSLGSIFDKKYHKNTKPEEKSGLMRTFGGIISNHRTFVYEIAHAYLKSIISKAYRTANNEMHHMVPVSMKIPVMHTITASGVSGEARCKFQSTETTVKLPPISLSQWPLT